MELTMKGYNKMLRDIVTKCKTKGGDVYDLVKEPLDKWEVNPEDVIAGKEYDDADKIIAQIYLDTLEGETLDGWYYENAMQDCPGYYAYGLLMEIVRDAKGADKAAIIGRIIELYIQQKLSYREVSKELDLYPVPEIPAFWEIKCKRNTYTE